MIYFITQELCDEASLFLALKHDVDIKITRMPHGIQMEGDEVTPLVKAAFLHYITYHFLEESELKFLRLAENCGLVGTINNILGRASNYESN